MKKLQIKYPILVEGKYDRLALLNVIEGQIDLLQYMSSIEQDNTVSDIKAETSAIEENTQALEQNVKAQEKQTKSKSKAY